MEHRVNLSAVEYGVWKALDSFDERMEYLKWAEQRHKVEREARIDRTVRKALWVETIRLIYAWNDVPQGIHELVLREWRNP